MKNEIFGRLACWGCIGFKVNDGKNFTCIQIDQFGLNCFYRRHICPYGRIGCIANFHNITWSIGNWFWNLCLCGFRVVRFILLWIKINGVFAASRATIENPELIISILTLLINPNGSSSEYANVILSFFDITIELVLIVGLEHEINVIIVNANTSDSIGNSFRMWWSVLANFTNSSEIKD